MAVRRGFGGPGFPTWLPSTSFPTKAPTSISALTSAPTRTPPTRFPTPAPTRYPTMAPNPYNDWWSNPTASPTTPSLVGSSSSSADAASSDSSGSSSVPTPILAGGILLFVLGLLAILAVGLLIRRRSAAHDEASEEDVVITGVPVARVKRGSRNAPDAIVVPVAEERDAARAALEAPPVRRRPSRRALATPPTNMDMSESDYRANLRAYLGQWAPDMDAEALTAYVDDADVSSEGRLALSEDLQLTHGQSLDDYYITNVRQRAAALRSALREAGAGTAYPVLLEHGVESLGALMDMDPALLEELFPDPAIRAAVANLANPL